MIGTWHLARCERLSALSCPDALAWPATPCDGSCLRPQEQSWGPLPHADSHSSLLGAFALAGLLSGLSHSPCARPSFLTWLIGL